MGQSLLQFLLKKFVRSSAGHAFCDGFSARAVLMSFAGTPAAFLRFLSLVSFMVRNPLAFIAMAGFLSSFQRPYLA
jgi:hypothetical protein